MIVSQAELDLILNPKIRRRLILLPVRYGPSGERKKCVAKPGGVYRLRARVPIDGYRMLAEREPTRARAVLRLLDLCERPTKAAVVTVQTVARAMVDGQEVYTVTFEKGDHAASLDRPVYLSKYGDYTFTASKQAVPGDPELMTPFAKDLERARATAKERRVSPQRQLVGKMQRDADMLHRALSDMKLRNRARRIAHDLKRLALELPSGEVVDCESALARDEPHEDADSPHPQGALATPEAA